MDEYFASQSRAKINQLKTQLKASKKKGPAFDYLLSIKKIVDTLAAVGAPLTTEEHIEVILNGLPQDYSSFITSIALRSDPYMVTQVEANLVQAHLAQTTISGQKGFGIDQQFFSPRGGKGGGRRGQGRGL